MHRKLPVVVWLLLVLAPVLAGPGVGAGSSTFVHFFVVPAAAKGGGDLGAELAKLRAKLISLAGGYTELGSSRGGSLEPGGKVDAESNYSFLVSAPRDLTADLEQYILRHFAAERPFILVWPAKSSL